MSDGSVINCLVYDTCGQERYNAINESYFKKADAALLVYDITERKSFDIVKNYYCISFACNSILSKLLSVQVYRVIIETLLLIF